MDILERVAQQHKDWVEMASIFDEDIAEDLVQEMYLTLHKYKVTEDKLYTKDKINRGYIFIIIRNIYFQIFNVKKRIKKEPLIDNCLEIKDDYNIEEELAWDTFRNDVEDEIDSWDWYDKKLFRLYRDNKISIRQLSAETGISFVSIFHSLKGCKNKIKDKFEKKYINLN